jgi:hypothetical protein
MEADQHMSTESGFAAHLVKPVDFPGLRAAIDRIMDEARKSRHETVETGRLEAQLIAP